VVKPLPIKVQLLLTATAFVLLHVTVKGRVSSIGLGLRVMVSVGSRYVCIFSNTFVSPPVPVAVQVQSDGLPTHAARAMPDALPLGAIVSSTLNPVPGEVQTRLNEVAFVLVQFNWKEKDATIFVGVRTTLSVGGDGAAFVFITSTTCRLPPAPVAVQVHTDG
jgi:hypothetical protein